MRALIAITCVLVCLATGTWLAERLYKSFGPNQPTNQVRLT